MVRMETFAYRPGLALDYTCGPKRPKALVVYAHGGSFMTGSRNDRLARHFAAELAAEGLAFATIDYRKGGKPLQGLAEDQVQAIDAASAQSDRVYPEISTRLFGPLLYRAAEDFGFAVTWLQSVAEGPRLHGVPLIVMGLSAGAMAAMAYAWGLDGMAPCAASPVLALGLAAVPPQPWRITKGHPTRGAVLLARGDEIMPRAAVARLSDDMAARGCRVEVAMIPYGQHNRPVRELIPVEGQPPSDWALWLLSHVRVALAGDTGC